MPVFLLLVNVQSKSAVSYPRPFFNLSNILSSDAQTRLSKPALPHIKMPLRKFVDGVQDNSIIQCLLDQPTVDGERPKFVKFLDDAHLAYMHSSCDQRIYTPLDLQKSASWLLLHHGLYHTFGHHDADGYGTWVQVVSGYKFWVILTPKVYEETRDRNRLQESVGQYVELKYNGQGYYGEESERVVIYAGPGDIVIMPPGTFHEVYTPVPSVTIGGHFYAFDTMHLTEIARALDHRTKGKFTNQDHPHAMYTMAVMMCSLPLFKEYRKVFSFSTVTAIILTKNSRTSPQNPRRILSYDTQTGGLFPAIYRHKPYIPTKEAGISRVARCELGQVNGNQYRKQAQPTADSPALPQQVP